MRVSLPGQDEIRGMKLVVQVLQSKGRKDSKKKRKEKQEVKRSLKHESVAKIRKRIGQSRGRSNGWLTRYILPNLESTALLGSCKEKHKLHGWPE